jgi:DNA-binding NarL/FixJ family response regulator
MDDALNAARARGSDDPSTSEGISAANGAGQVRVLVVDDDAPFREALAELLRAHDLEVVGTAESGEEAIERVLDLAPDVVLMDMQMPGMTGAQAAARLFEIAPVSRVVMLTISGADDDVLEAMLAGASGYLVKGIPPDGLVAGIRAAAAGAALLSPGIAAQLLGRLRTDATASARPAAAILSDRELEVLELIARGKANAEIARTLFLSPNTVRNHISNILAKLQISNRTEATAYAIRNRLV